MQTIKTKHITRSRGPGQNTQPARSPRRIQRTLLLLATLACTTLLLAACGSSGNSSSTGASQPAASGSDASQSSANSSQAAKFSQCMRKDGVPDFPDPNANGSITLKVTSGSDLDPNSAAFKDALSKCKSLEPPGFGSNSSQSTASQNKLLTFVACMRKHGVPNFPDPSSSGALVMKSSSGIDPNSPTFQAAMQKCRSLLPNGGNGASASAG